MRIKGELIRDYRSQKGLTYRQMAVESNGEISHQAIFNAEKGQIDSLKKLLIIARLIGLNPQDLLEQDCSEPTPTPTPEAP
jgi:transcriptional regulator with XRE-family HTH domain